MKLDIQNLGIIESGTIELNGLTVIAGENDTGKSTIGKILYSLIKADNMDKRKKQQQIHDRKHNTLKQVLGLVFTHTIFRNCTVRLSESETLYEMTANKNGTLAHHFAPNSPFMDATFIESPLVWNMTDFFATVERMKTEDAMYGIAFDVKYPYILWDLYRKLMTEKSFYTPFEEEHVEQILREIENIMQGRLIKEGNQFYYRKGSKNISLFHTASGIKTFGILQVLFEHTYINPKNLVIFDEPEVHLHPKWEILLAKILASFVRSGVKIIVNTHSIYMVQALKVYTKEFREKSNFYLLEKQENGMSTIRDVTEDPYPIFQKFNDPIQELVWGNDDGDE